MSVDVNYRAKLWDVAAARPVLAELVAQADIVFAGREEAGLLLGGPGTAPPDELARALTALGPREAIVKDGARGATAVVDGRVLHRPALEVAVVDPVGAGDALVAAYLAEHLTGRSPAQRLDTAVTVAGLAVTVPGDCEGLPRHDELPLARQRDVMR